MVAFKEEFPYLRCDSGQLFEFNRDWLHAAITRAADQAGYPSWWLTDHVTESIAFSTYQSRLSPTIVGCEPSEPSRSTMHAIRFVSITLGR